MITETTTPPVAPAGTLNNAPFAARQLPWFAYALEHNGDKRLITVLHPTFGRVLLVFEDEAKANIVSEVTDFTNPRGHRSVRLTGAELLEYVKLAILNGIILVATDPANSYCFTAKDFATGSAAEGGG